MQPARFQDGAVFLSAAAMKIGDLAESHCGADITDPTNAQVFVQCAAILRDQFGEMGLSEMETAFNLALAGRFEAPMICFKGRYTVAMFSTMLRGYRTVRMPIIAQLSKGLDMIGEQTRDEATKRQNEFFLQELIVRFEALKKDNSEFATSADIPVGWGELLCREGVLDNDATLWVECKKEVAMAFLEDTDALRPNIMCGTLDACIKLAERMRADKQFFPDVLRDAAKNLYGRRLVSRQLAPYTPA